MTNDADIYDTLTMTKYMERQERRGDYTFTDE